MRTEGIGNFQADNLKVTNGSAQGMHLAAQVFIAREDVVMVGLPTFYRAKRDFMLEQMARYFSAEVSWSRPQRGFFIFAYLPPCMDAGELFHLAVERKVVFVTDQPFSLTVAVTIPSDCHMLRPIMRIWRSLSGHSAN